MTSTCAQTQCRGFGDGEAEARASAASRAPEIEPVEALHCSGRLAPTDGRAHGQDGEG